MSDDNSNGSGSSDQKDKKEQQERLELAASKVISETLGMPLDEKGKVDFNSIDQASLQAHAGELIPALIRVYAKETGGSGPAGLTADFLKAIGEQLKLFKRSDDDPRKVDDVGGVTNALGAWADETKIKFSQFLHNSLGLPLNSDGVVDSDALDDSEIQEKVAKRFIDFAGSVGKVVEQIKTKGKEAGIKIGAGAEPGEPQAADDSQSQVEDASDDDDSDNVIDLNEFRRQVEEKRSSMAFKIGDSLQDTISSFIEEHIASAQETGNINLNLDESFFREHGPALLSAALKDLSKSIVPPKIEINLPMPDETEKDGEPSPDGEGEQATDGEAINVEATKKDAGVKVALNLDLGSLFKGLFKPKE